MEEGTKPLARSAVSRLSRFSRLSAEHSLKTESDSEAHELTTALSPGGDIKPVWDVEGDSVGSNESPRNSDEWGASRNSSSQASSRRVSEEDVAGSIASVLRSPLKKGSLLSQVRTAVAKSKSFRAYYGGDRKEAGHPETHSSDNPHIAEILSNEDSPVQRRKTKFGSPLQPAKEKRPPSHFSFDADIHELSPSSCRKEMKLVSEHTSDVSILTVSDDQNRQRPTYIQLDEERRPRTAAFEDTAAVAAETAAVASALALVSSCLEAILLRVPFTDEVEQPVELDPDLIYSLHLHHVQWHVSITNLATLFFVTVAACADAIVGGGGEFLLSVVTVLTALQLFFTVTYHYLAHLRLQAKDPLTHLHSFLCPMILLELCFTAVHCPPTLPNTWGDARLLNLFIVCRGTSIVRIIRDWTFTNTPGSLLSGSLGIEKLTTTFLGKTLLYRFPLRTLAAVSLIFFLITFLIFVGVEADTEREGGISGGNSITAGWWDVVWLQLVTMTTVGYGDIVPITFLSRLTAGVCAIGGIVLSSLSVALLIRGLDLTKREKVIALFAEECSKHLTVMHLASKIIGDCFRIWKLRRAIASVTDQIVMDRSLNTSWGTIWTGKELDITAYSGHALTGKLKGMMKQFLREKEMLKRNCQRLRSMRRVKNDVDILEVLPAPVLLVLQQDTIIQRMVIPKVHVEKMLEEQIPLTRTKELQHPVQRLIHSPWEGKRKPSMVVPELTSAPSPSSTCRRRSTARSLAHGIGSDILSSSLNSNAWCGVSIESEVNRIEQTVEAMLERCNSIAGAVERLAPALRRRLSMKRMKATRVGV